MHAKLRRPVTLLAVLWTAGAARADTSPARPDPGGEGQHHDRAHHPDQPDHGTDHPAGRDLAPVTRAAPPHHGHPRREALARAGRGANHGGPAAGLHVPGHDSHAGDDADALGSSHHERGDAARLSLGVVAGHYDAKLFSGDYQGAIAGARYARGRLAAGFALPAYRLTKNGRTVGGLGDLALHGHATLLESGELTAGVMAMAMLPSGNDEAGLGMGHAMGMTEVWGGYTSRTFAATATLGYSHALGGSSAHAAHGGGMWPLVDPMNATELSFGATAMFALARALAVGARTAGGVPVGTGDMRLASGVRLVWREGRVETAAEILGGVIGDPFTLRGVLETAVRFR